MNTDHLVLQLSGQPARRSEVYFGRDRFEEIVDAVNSRLAGRRDYWIWDRRVWDLWGERLVERGWPGMSSGRVLVYDALEERKRLGTIEDLGRELIRRGADRASVLVAVGGGVTGDMVGFLAAIFMRGIGCFQVPTTLLAQVDSSIGGKTAVDLPEGKNLLGAFHQAEAVWIYSGWLESLSPEAFRQGLAEIVKTAMLADAALFETLERDAERLLQRDPEALIPVIRACCRIKAHIVETDEREAGRRRHLNLGHTTGHALERLSDYAMPHGDAVAAGLAVASELSVRTGKLTPGERDRVEALCRKLGLPVRITGGYAPRAVMDAMQSDKKRVGDSLYFVAMEGIGNAVDLVNPDPEVLEAVLRDLSAPE